METLVFTKVDTLLALTMNNIFVLLHAQFFSRNLVIHKTSSQPSEIVVYLASIVDKATHFCNLDCYDIVPPTKVNKYSNVDFLESISRAISTSM